VLTRVTYIAWVCCCRTFVDVICLCLGFFFIDFAAGYRRSYSTYCIQGREQSKRLYAKRKHSSLQRSYRSSYRRHAGSNKRQHVPPSRRREGPCRGRLCQWQQVRPSPRSSRRGYCVEETPDRRKSLYLARAFREDLPLAKEPSLQQHSIHIRQPNSSVSPDTPYIYISANESSALVGFLLSLTPLSNVLLGWRGAGGLGAAEV